MSNNAVLAKIFKRTFIIFLLGYLMYWFPFVHWNEKGELAFNPINHTRIFGVLQRIALAYCAAALMIKYFKLKTVIRLSFTFLIIYWLILLLFKGSSDPYDMLTNAGTRLDLWLLGPYHLYHGQGVPFDPEGLLSSLPSIANITFGFAAGKWIQEKGNSYEGLAKLLLAGSVFIFISLYWNNFFPINKKLWTGSFVLLTVGIDCILISALVFTIDFLKIKRFNYFFEVPGKNPLFVYLVSELAATLLGFFMINDLSLHKWFFQNIFSKAGMYFGSFLFAVVFMMCCWLLGYVLDKKKIYIRV